MRRGSPRREPDVDPVRLTRHLRHRSWRDGSGLFAAEGVRCLIRAARRPERIEHLIVSWKLLQSVPARQAIRRLRRDGVRCTPVSPETFRSLSTLPRASGVTTILRQEWVELADVDPRTGSAWLLLREARSPGNVGTLLRTLAATDGGGLVLLGDQIDPFDPVVVRATMGAHLDTLLVRTNLTALARFRQRHRMALIGTSPAADIDYGAVEWQPGAWIFLGGERTGLSADDEALCDLTVRIPMTDRVDSLNQGVAGSLMLYEAYRAWRAR